MQPHGLRKPCYVIEWVDWRVDGDERVVSGTKNKARGHMLLGSCGGDFGAEAALSSAILACFRSVFTCLLAHGRKNFLGLKAAPELRLGSK
jgi:hypothetical protein